MRDRPERDQPWLRGWSAPQTGQVQVERGYGEEGYSIPVQREACERKAGELGATVVQCYVDLAKTAKTRNRPRFMEMVTDIERDRNIDYVIVHKLNRFARNPATTPPTRSRSRSPRSTGH